MHLKQQSNQKLSGVRVTLKFCANDPSPAHEFLQNSCVSNYRLQQTYGYNTLTIITNVMALLTCRLSILKLDVKIVICYRLLNIIKNFR